MTTIEVLAMAAIRRWCFDRLKLQSGQRTNYKRAGWQERNTRQMDARHIRVIDFERVLAKLPASVQVMLLLAHRDGYAPDELATMGNVDTRTIKAHLRVSLAALGQLLDAEGLL